MKATLNSDENTLEIEDAGARAKYPLFSKEAFEILSREWVRIGWSLRYNFTFTWWGLPIVQIPEDLIRFQEVVYALQPDIIIETGVFRGGSLLFHGSLLALLGKGRVIGVERAYWPETRSAIERSPFAARIVLIEGDSTAPETLRQIRTYVGRSDKVMVILDSDHDFDHVAKELQNYAAFVTPGSCILVEDAIMQDLHDCPGGKADWAWDNPGTAIRTFLADNQSFEQKTPQWLFNDSPLSRNITHWPGGWLWRRDHR